MSLWGDGYGFGIGFLRWALVLGFGAAYAIL